MKKIVVVGEILSEIMADTQGDGFLEPLQLSGPYPSGAPAIYVDQVARVGQPCAIISAVGDDDFGLLNTRRLQADGVDISGIAIDADRPTGTAFVRYRKDGNRDFIFNIRHSACGRIPESARIDNVLDEASHLHIMGSSISSEDYTSLNLRLAKALKARGGTVSFDPNLRKEIFSRAGASEIVAEILSLTDLYLPSGDEIFLLNDASTPEAAARTLIQRGIKAVVHKLGVEGAHYYDKHTRSFVQAFQVEEVDPTGAGDCFGGVFTALWLQGMPPERALTLACAAGALAVTKRGPMEGASFLPELEKLAASRFRTTA